MLIPIPDKDAERLEQGPVSDNVMYQEGDALQRPAPTSYEVDQMEQDLVEHIFELDTMYEGSQYRQDKIKDSDINRRLYAQKTDPKAKDWPWKGASCITLPLISIAVDNIEPRLVSALEGKGEEVCRFQDLGETDPDLQDIQGWFNEELIHGVQIRKKIRGFTHDGLLDGTVFTIPSYVHKEEIRTDFKFVEQPVMLALPNPLDPTAPPVAVPVNETGQPIQDGEMPFMQRTDEIAIDPETGEMLTEDYIDPLYDGGDLEILDFKDVKCPDNCEDWEEADIIREVNIRYGDLCRWQEEGVVGFKNINEDIFTEAVTEVTVDGVNKGAPNQTIHGCKVIPCLEALIQWDFQTQYERDSGKYVGYQKIVALVTKTSRKLIRLCLQRDINFQGKKHIRRLRLNPEFGRSLGTAPATKLREVQIGASDTFNIILNSAYICMIPWFFYGPSSGMDTEVEIIPGKGIPCTDPSQVKFPTFNVDPGRYVEFINIFFSLWEKLSSVSDVQVGRAPEIQGNRAQTATGTMMQVQESNVKHSYSGKMLQEEFAEILDMLYDLYYMHCPMEVIWESQGKQKVLNKARMRKKKRFVLTGTTEASNKYVDRMEAESLYSMAQANPLANQHEVFIELLKSYGKDQPEKYIDPMLNQVIMAYKQNPELVVQAIQAGMQMAAGMQAGAAEADAMSAKENGPQGPVGA